MVPLWRQLLKKNFLNWERLADFLELSPTDRKQILKNPKFPLNLPYRLALKIKKGTLDDPILKQFLPLVEESKDQLGFSVDPTADISFQRSSKLLHKYEGRALIAVTSACSQNCRYCFRQNYPYETEDKTYEEELKILNEDSSIKEVILSGGDPLSLSNTVLEKLVLGLDNIPHLKRIRFHTRFPIAIPERIDEGFLALVKSTRCQIIFVIHANHANELDDEVLAALKQLGKAGVMMLNQSVLLRGVNDEVEVLQKLSEVLVDNGVQPYYLHQLDRVKGAVHFEVEEEVGRSLVQELNKVLPGYAVPKYVREVAGQPHKTPL